MHTISYYTMQLLVRVALQCSTGRLSKWNFASWFAGHTHVFARLSVFGQLWNVQLACSS